MANWLRMIMPKQEKFFPLFNSHADQVVNAAGQLHALLAGAPGARDGELDREVDAGHVTSRRILDQLRQSFVTPFDRSDIKEMTASMQSLLEDMRAVARVHGKAGDVQVDGLSALVVECAGELKKGVGLLDDFDKHADELRNMRDRIGALRTRMLVLRDDATTALLTGDGAGPMRTLAASRLLERVGALVERFDQVADHIDDLVLDHV